MKQNITIQQWDELTHEQKNKLDDYGCKSDWAISIGQMIEFLEDKLVEMELYRDFTGWYVSSDSTPGGEWKSEKFREELCDALWEACKEVLEKE